MNVPYRPVDATKNGYQVLQQVGDLGKANAHHPPNSHLTPVAQPASDYSRFPLDFDHISCGIGVPPVFEILCCRGLLGARRHGGEHSKHFARFDKTFSCRATTFSLMRRKMAIRYCNRWEIWGKRTHITLQTRILHPLHNPPAITAVSH
ncbi:hypothetical protein [Microseira wollei]|uniref:hypothetical protein n=1 Tax=Microseira wollei TaxID=467598 RepID=UPI001CFC4F7C|nr:hypothetical protein [Microseira wollei]